MGELSQEKFGGSGRGGENGGVVMGGGDGSETGSVTKMRGGNRRPVSVPVSARSSGIKRRARRRRLLSLV